MRRRAPGQDGRSPLGRFKSASGASSGSRPPRRAKRLVVKLSGGRGASAVMGLFMLAVGSSASAQDMPASSNVSAAVKAVDVSAAGEAARHSRRLRPRRQSRPGNRRRRPRSRRQRRRCSAAGAVGDAQPGAAVDRDRGRWLYKGGWPLYALVDKYATSAPLDEQTNCLATAVYFEARGESLEGQLAVARVVMNRAASGRYPPTGAASSSSRRNSRSSATASFPRSNTIPTRGARPRRSPGSLPPMSFRASPPTCCGTTPNYVAPSWRPAT